MASAAVAPPQPQRQPQGPPQPRQLPPQQLEQAAAAQAPARPRPSLMQLGADSRASLRGAGRASAGARVAVRSASKAASRAAARSAGKGVMGEQVESDLQVCRLAPLPGPASRLARACARVEEHLPACSRSLYGLIRLGAGARDTVPACEVAEKCVPTIHVRIGPDVALNTCVAWACSIRSVASVNVDVSGGEMLLHVVKRLGWSQRAGHRRREGGAACSWRKRPGRQRRQRGSAADRSAHRGLSCHALRSAAAWATLALRDSTRFVEEDSHGP